jgi:hypothetical protein
MCAGQWQDDFARLDRVEGEVVEELPAQFIPQMLHRIRKRRKINAAQLD